MPLRAGVFLVATPSLMDPNFIHSVILLINYGEKGAIGLIINRPAFLLLQEVLPDNENIGGSSLPLYIGGPVSQDTLFILFASENPPDDAQKVFQNIYFATSRDTILQTIKKWEEGDLIKVFAGYAGWGPGQLENEIKRGAWLTVEADSKTIFSDEPSRIWPSIFQVPQDIMVENYIKVFQGTRTILPKFPLPSILS